MNKMDTKELLDILKEQLKNLDSYLKICIDKQYAIVEGSYEKLQQALTDEERALNTISRLEASRVKKTEEIKKFYNISLKNDKVTDLIYLIQEHIPEEILNSFNKVQHRMSKVIVETNRINQQNKILINQSREFIKTLVGELLTLNKQTLIDRKI